MKKRLLAVLVLSSLALTSIAPAVLAQDNDNGRDRNIQYVDCSQVAAAFQGQYAAAVADEGAVVAVANEQGITIRQANACLGQADVDDDKKDDKKDDVMADTIPAGKLPNTGGPSLLAIGAGLALVACGASLIGFTIRR